MKQQGYLNDAGLQGMANIHYDGMPIQYIGFLPNNSTLS